MEEKKKIQWIVVLLDEEKNHVLQMKSDPLELIVLRHERKAY